jgi:hypothetical protein
MHILSSADTPRHLMLIAKRVGHMAVCCQNLTLGALSSRSALSVLVGALFKKFGLFLNTPRITLCRVRRPRYGHFEELYFLRLQDLAVPLS